MKLTALELMQRNREYYAQHKNAVKLAAKLWRERNREINLAAKREYYRANREKMNKRTREWMANNRDRRRSYLRNYMKSNPGVNLRWQETYREKNRESIRERHKQWSKNNPAKVRQNIIANTIRRRKAEGKYTDNDLQMKLIEQSGRCFDCFQPLRHYHVEHIIPISKGGTHWPYNIALSCPPWNLRKGSKVGWKAHKELTQRDERGT